MLNRSVRILLPDDSHAATGLCSFGEALRYSNLVVLGDPGSGKTTLMTAANKVEGGTFFHARNFGIYATSDIAGKTIFIDALDEKRSRSDHPDSIAVIVEKLLATKPSRVRISCRALDWLGETDLTLFRPYFEANGGFAVVQLHDLDAEEQKAVLFQKDIRDAERFFDEAEKRGVGPLLKNPQTLTMLADVVKGGIWPETRFQLFNEAAKLLIREHNETKEHQTKQLFEPPELEAAAGAVCASMLISDEPSVSLRRSSASLGGAAYDRAPFANKDAVLSVLGRRAFQTCGDHSVTYCHRTVAEFLAAKWLSQIVKAGYPLGRALSLISVDGIPALELRGLYAWLPVFLPSHAYQLIQKEPLAVVLYGDPKALSPASRRTLLGALQDLSERDPWFTQWGIDEEILGNLSGHDMVEGFRSILGGEPENYHIRFFVLDAIAYGPQLPEMEEDLFTILENEAAPYGDRQRAFKALIRTAPRSADRISRYTRERLLLSGDQCRLAAEIIRSLFSECFTADDVAQLIRCYLKDRGRHVVGELWLLSESMPEADVVQVVDALFPVIEAHCQADWRHKSEVVTFFSRLVVAALKQEPVPGSAKIWQWLTALYLFRRSTNLGSSEHSELRNWLLEHPHLVQDFFDLAWSARSSERWWVILNDFFGTILHAFGTETLISKLMIVVEDIDQLSSRRAEAYAATLTYVYQNASNSRALFEQLYAYSQSEPFSKEFTDLSLCPVDRWEHEAAVRTLAERSKTEESRQKHRNDFDAAEGLIRSGEHKGWLAWCANVYFAIFSDVADTPDRRERLLTELGEERTETVLAAFQAAANKSHQLPSLSEILDLRRKERFQPWWRAIIAGCDIDWENRGTIVDVSDRLLEAALAIELYYPVFDKTENQYKPAIHGWLDASYRERADFAVRVFFECAKEDLANGRASSDAIYRLTQNELLKAASGASTADLLRRFPNASPEILRTLLASALSNVGFLLKINSAIEKLLTSLEHEIGVEQREIWLATAFLTCEEQLPDMLLKQLETNRKLEMLWAIQNAVFAFPINTDHDGLKGLPDRKAKFLVEQFGSNFPIEAHPEDGWSGRQNNWDANDFTRRLIDELSTRTGKEAKCALEQLSEDSTLVTCH
ncbi:conserved hypothetical protein [Rhizobium leguminosarum bv. trifolii WSM2304]|uniref:ATP-binding protein n=2 Tax=Rhizobium leguminosarum TaxID=384 RepID=A0ABF7QIZ2_RHILW|nr:conserved hypothetical protein [Rhizobium leguminosarum bv. trifolii WSM2304]